MVLYLVAQIALAFHIRHGAWSLFQSVGANNPRFNKFRRTFANTFTAIVVIGFLAVPFGTVFGIIQ